MTCARRMIGLFESTPSQRDVDPAVLRHTIAAADFAD
jgi:hypothetical protein